MSASDKINRDKARLVKAILNEFEDELTNEEIEEVSGGFWQDKNKTFDPGDIVSGS